MILIIIGRVLSILVLFKDNTDHYSTDPLIWSVPKSIVFSFLDL